MGRSFPGIDGTNMDRQQLDLMNKAISSTMDLLMQSRTTLYVIDPTVNVAPPQPHSSMPSEAQTRSPLFRQTDPLSTGFNFKSFVQSRQAESIFTDANDLNIVRDRRKHRPDDTDFYTLSYVPGDPIQDGSTGKIDIRLKNPNLLVVQTKLGYYPAHPDETTITAERSVPNSICMRHSSPA